MMILFFLFFVFAQGQNDTFDDKPSFEGTQNYENSKGQTLMYKSVKKLGKMDADLLIVSDHRGICSCL